MKTTAEPSTAHIARAFLHLGATAYGGLAMVEPVRQRVVVDRGWLNQQEFLDGILLGFVTPGPIIITATFVGYWLRGLVGALAATVTVFLPPILMIIFLTPFYQRIKEGQWVRAVVQGILAALVGMLVLVTLQMGRAALVDWQSWAIMVGAVAALIGLRVDLLWVALATAGVSLVLF